MIAARLADGGTDWRKGIEKLKELKPNVFRWFNTSNDIDTLLPRGEAGVAACFGSFRSYLLIDGGMPGKFITPTEGSPMGVLSYHIPANAPNRDLLLEFVNHALDAQVQTNFGNAMTSGMANTKVQLEQRVVDRIASPDELLRIDWNVIQDNYADITAAMQREVII